MTDQVAEVKSKIDIVEVIASYLPLKKSGRNFAALCPFHGEKTPSFFVSGDRQAFKCFGCGEAGDVFTFLEKMENWDFPEALEELAKRAGVKLTKFAPTGVSKVREKLVEIHKLASRFYHHLLTVHPQGAVARDYLKGRGINQALWEKFELGYSPGGWDQSLNFFKKRGFSLEDIALSGLIIASTRKSAGGNSYYDRFRDRLIFPLKDNRGTILGFAGRVIAAGEPKYINSPETPIFNKGSLLFGLDVAKKVIREKNEVVLVEGEFDVLSCHQAGVENTVASKGTALTDRQVALLARQAENVTLAFDEDVAGDAAARRGIELLDLAGVNIKVVDLGKFGDPDEFAQKDARGFKQAIAGAVNIYDFLIESATRRHDSHSAVGKKKIGAEILPILGKISDDLMRAHYIGRLAHILELEVDLVAQAVAKKVASIEFAPYAPQNQTAPAATKVMEEYFLALFVFGSEITRKVLSLVSPFDFENPFARRFWQWMHDIIKSPAAKSANLKKIISRAPKDLSAFVDELYLINVSVTFEDKQLWAEEIVKIASRLKVLALKRQLAAIARLLLQAQRNNDTQQVRRLTQKFDKLSENLKEQQEK